MSTQTVGTVPEEWTMGDRLRKAREAAGFDQVDLAELIGVSRTTVSNHEVGVGKRAPRACCCGRGRTRPGCRCGGSRVSRDHPTGPTWRY